MGDSAEDARVSRSRLLIESCCGQECPRAGVVAVPRYTRSEFGHRTSAFGL